MARDIVEVTCYGITERMSRGMAVRKYMDCIMHSEGAERDRYIEIYFQLCEGKKVCSDGTLSVHI